MGGLELVNFFYKESKSNKIVCVCVCVFLFCFLWGGGGEGGGGGGETGELEKVHFFYIKNPNLKKKELFVEGVGGGRGARVSEFFY